MSKNIYLPITFTIPKFEDFRGCLSVPYETEDEMEKAVTGKKKSEGGILPDDNVRIYVPMDLNADGIMRQLYALYGALGEPTESNESVYYSGVRKIITQLEIYDQVWVARKVEESVQKENGGVRHSRKGIELAGEIINYLEENEGASECFPYDEVEELRDAFWL
ncbi:MAG: hypothetical protein PUG00_00410 [Clostridiales bacterium]|nr:hypothetical protein [Clostridiales bacterium]